MNFNPRTLIATASVAAVAAVTLGAGTVNAQAPDEAELGPRIERACKRVPNLQLRTDRLLTRITGDAETVGSLAWLDARIATAEERGRDELVEVLTNRRGVREATVPVLELRTDALADLAERCVANGIDI